MIPSFFSQTVRSSARGQVPTWYSFERFVNAAVNRLKSIYNPVRSLQCNCFIFFSTWHILFFIDLLLFSFIAGCWKLHCVRICECNVCNCTPRCVCTCECNVWSCTPGCECNVCNCTLRCPAEDNSQLTVDQRRRAWFMSSPAVVDKVSCSVMIECQLHCVNDVTETLIIVSSLFLSLLTSLYLVFKTDICFDVPTQYFW